MVHTQEATAWCIFVASYAYFCFAVWFLKHHSTNDEPPVAGWVDFPYYVDKGLKVAFMILWIIMALMNCEYHYRLVGHGNPVVRVEYFLFMQLFTTFGVLVNGVLKNFFRGAVDESNLENTATEVSFKNAACMFAAVWMTGYGVWQMCWFSNSFFAGLSAWEEPGKVGVTACVLITASFVYSLGISRFKAVNFVDTTDDLTGVEARDRPVIGTSPGLLVEIVNDWAFVVVFNMLSIYMWTVIFNNYGQIFFAILIQQFATMYCTHWSGTWNAWFEFFQFFTMIVCQMYMFVPGTFFRQGFTTNATPTGEYQHLMFLMDQGNADMGFPAGVMKVNQMAITGVSLAIAFVCFAFTVKHANGRSNIGSKVGDYSPAVLLTVAKKTGNGAKKVASGLDRFANLTGLGSKKI